MLEDDEVERVKRPFSKEKKLIAFSWIIWTCGWIGQKKNPKKHGLVLGLTLRVRSFLQITQKTVYVIKFKAI